MYLSQRVKWVRVILFESKFFWKQLLLRKTNNSRNYNDYLIRVHIQPAAIHLLQPVEISTAPANSPAVKNTKVSEISINQNKSVGAAPAKEALTSKESAVNEADISDALRYTIQVASFKQEKEAQDLAKKLETKGHKTFVLPKGAYLIVCVGRFAGKNEAESYSGKIKDRYSDYVIRRL